MHPLRGKPSKLRSAHRILLEWPQPLKSTSTTPPTKWLLYIGLHFATDQLKYPRGDFEQLCSRIGIVALSSRRHAFVSEPPQFVGIDYHGTPLLSV